VVPGAMQGIADLAWASDRCSHMEGSDDIARRGLYRARPPRSPIGCPSIWQASMGDWGTRRAYRPSCGETREGQGRTAPLFDIVQQLVVPDQRTSSTALGVDSYCSGAAPSRGAPRSTNVGTDRYLSFDERLGPAWRNAQGTGGCTTTMFARIPAARTLDDCEALPLADPVRGFDRQAVRELAIASVHHTDGTSDHRPVGGPRPGSAQES